MPYRVRVFCIHSSIPSLSDVFEYAKSRGVNLAADETQGPIDIHSADWTQAEIVYKPGKSPLVVECGRDDGTEECLARAEPQEFIEEIGSPGFSLAKRRIIKHLKTTKFIVASQLLNDIDDDGYDANGTFLSYFVEHCGGMIHADGEGFYDKDKLIFEMR